MIDLDQLMDGFVDEDEGDETREALLREAGEVLDEGARVRGNQDQAQGRGPEADPEAKRQVVETGRSGYKRNIRQKRLLICSIVQFSSV